MLLTYANTERVNQEVSQLGHTLHTFGALGPPVRAPLLPSASKSAPFEASVSFCGVLSGLLDSQVAWGQ